MPVIATVGRKKPTARLLIFVMYLMLTAMGITMVVPFLITVSGSFCNEFDYQRYYPIPKFLFSKQDRYVKDIAFFFSKSPKAFDQMGAYFKDMPAYWVSWGEVGKDSTGVSAFARRHLESMRNGDMEKTMAAAADYSRFVDGYPIDDLVCPVSNIESTSYLEKKLGAEWRAKNPGDKSFFGSTASEKGALDILNKRWETHLTSFYSLDFEKTMNNQPLWNQGWLPPSSQKYDDYRNIKELYRSQYFTPGVRSKWRKWMDGKSLSRQEADIPAEKEWQEFKAENYPASPAVPFATRALWKNFLESDTTRMELGISGSGKFDIAAYNRIAGTKYGSLREIPFPIPAGSCATLKKLWNIFVDTRYPIRLMSFDVSPEMQLDFESFLKERFKNVEYANRILKTSSKDWNDFKLQPSAPSGPGSESIKKVWVEFVKKLPRDVKKLRSSEKAYQEFVLAKYGSIENINKAYGWNLNMIEEAFPPFEAAYGITFRNNDWSFVTKSVTGNYIYVVTFLMKRGQAILVTFLLVGFTILSVLTVNPLCAYALSRFSIRGKDKIILYLLAVTAFPAMVSAIPAYLLMRDLGLLNTFFALILPHAAGGMAIFMLKGFFDSLPPELYEAATIDGANEFQNFIYVTLPLMKPILAVKVLGAFIGAYASWEWAIIICQNQEMWTISVWMYQASQWWASTPWVVSAGFVIVSIPILIVFLSCQKIILEGIILPQMK
ncbi:MAG TPA: hypothetical protein DET40_03210 [Lentisphaeria bacterium]|nr:MAG: hypothetical protein A2X45_22280 [Lentisphaerae bacterium GWF2_50_93]HCE42540.1 hypothetical protein [Lentisphaeria bacterium]